MDCVSGGNLPWPKQKSENQKVESHKGKSQKSFLVARNGWVNRCVIIVFATS